MVKQDLLDHLYSLGLISQVSSENELAEHLGSGRRTVYCGFDPTADSLHVGNLVPLLALRRFQLAGHRPILLVGGATGMVGDPGGRTTERELRSPEEVEAFLGKIREQARQFLDFDCGATSAIVVDNADWIRGMTVIEFLRDIGKHFSVNAMIQKDMVRRRLEDESTGISYTEFSYAILQSWDFVVLNQRYDCTIQMGGSDQWGNITSGIDLVRRMEGKQAFAITYPLITNADGSKLGKSIGGAPWLDPQKTSPYSFYQFWVNCADKDVIRFLKIFTLIHSSKLARLEAAHNEEPGRRTAHTALAREVTRMVHGDEGLEAATRITDAVFSNAVDQLAEEDLRQLALDGLPTTEISRDTASLQDVLVDSGLAVTPRGEVTRGQARKLIQSNAVAVNGEKINDTEYMLTRDAALYCRYHILQKGKKTHHLVVLGANGQVNH